MNSIVSATFDSMEEARQAVDGIKSKFQVLDLKLESVTPRETSFSFLAPLYLFGDADRAEQTHGNLIPPIVTGMANRSGKTRVKLMLNAHETAAVQSDLRNNGHSVSIKTLRD